MGWPETNYRMQKSYNHVGIFPDIYMIVLKVLERL